MTFSAKPPCSLFIYSVIVCQCVLATLIYSRGAGGEGVLPYMGYIGMCRCEGYGFQVIYSMWSLVRPALGPAGFSLWCNFRYNTNETFPVFIDLLTFLNSIRSFPDASEALEN